MFWKSETSHEFFRTLRCKPSTMTIAFGTLQERIGRELGVSSWRLVPQGTIDCFAAATGDRQFVQVDPTRAERETSFGGTIAHGFLTLSLLSAFALEALPGIEGC